MEHYKRIIIDTNIMRRLLENNNKYNCVMNYYMDKQYKFFITDHSMFELFDYLDNQNTEYRNYDLIIQLIKKFEIELIYREDSRKLTENYNNFLYHKYSVIEVKKMLFSSFKFSLKNFLVNLYSLSILALANSLDDDYTSLFYSHIRTLYENNRFNNAIQEHVDLLIENGYISGKIKINKFVKKELKDMVLRVLCYYELLKNRDLFTKEEFNSLYDDYDKKYKNKPFNEIIKENCKSYDLKLENKNNIDELSHIYISGYIKNILLSGKSFSINDVVDFLNFKTAYENNILYMTGDGNSLKNMKKVFCNENDVLDYIDRIEKIWKIPYNVLLKN